MLRLTVALAALMCLVGSAGAGIYVPPPPGDVLPTWSPDGSVIVFFSTREGTALRVVNPDGTGERQIPWLPANATYSFSPDWSHVAAQTESGHMVVERLDGSERVDLGSAAFTATPSWSPDGSRITYVVPNGQPDAGADVVVARIDGSEVSRIVSGIEPQWSTAGDRIAYLRGEPGDLQLHLIRADGTDDTQVTAATGFLEPRWSPDGTRIAAMLGMALAVVDAATGQTTTIDRNGRPSIDYAWSPRADAIAYSTPAGIRTVDVTTGRVRRVTSFGFGPAWSPDGRQLAFAAGGECRNRMGIYRLDLDRRGADRITNDCRIVGTSGDDVLTGTSLADVLVGEAGNDTLKAVWGDFIGDTLEGGPGKDLLLGSFRGDTLEGGSDADILRGGPSPDRIVGGAGRDVLEGQGGRDAIYARDGRRDVVSCGTNVGGTTGPEGDVAYVDRGDRVSRDCEYVYRPGPAAPVRGRIRLAIRVWPQGNLDPKNPRTDYTLRCRPAGGTLPRTRTACARLLRVQNPFAPVSPAEACPQVYAGDEVATVIGVYGGRRVGARFDRLSSCAVGRWNRVSFLFPIPPSSRG
jgi:Ca2+-binding RTX toxin-like protein